MSLRVRKHERTNLSGGAPDGEDREVVMLLGIGHKAGEFGIHRVDDLGRGPAVGAASTTRSTRTAWSP
ncbi:MAG: hypothetical protein AAEJ43_14230 [Gammaproteobacteria bacterium]